MVDALKKKQTITSAALRLGTFRLAFSGSFFTSSWKGQWHNRPLGSFDMSSPLMETLVREVIRSADKNTSRARTLSIFPLWLRSQGSDEAKYQLGGWIYCCSIVQHK